MAKKLKLSKSKRKFAETRKKPVLLRGEPLRRNDAAENRFSKSLSDAIRKMANSVEKKIRAEFKKNKPEDFLGTGQDASLGSSLRVLINKLRKEYQRDFGENGKQFTNRMLRQIDSHSKSTSKSSIEKLAGGVAVNVDFTTETKELLKISTSRSVNLIKSIQSEYFNNIEDLVMRSILPGGNGLEDLKELDKIKNKSINRGINIAKDQTRKALNNLNAIRMEKAGVQEFVWRHSGGSKDPRDLHLNELNGKTFRLDDLPIIDKRTGERGLPGQLPNCKCFMEPVAKFGGE